MNPAIEHLRSITTFSSLVKYLRDQLDWEFETDDVEDLTYDYDATEFDLGTRSAAAIRAIKQFRPLVDNQPWGIFYLDFAGQRISVATLRDILRGLVAKKRASANQSEMRKWQVENLLFICTSDDFKNFNFAYFRGSQTNRAVLSSFGWRHGDTHLRTLAEYNLPALRFPSDTSNAENWLKKWRAAFDVEAVTDKFFDDYHEVFLAIEKEVKATIKTDEGARLYTQRLFNRLMFIYFIQKKGWLSFNGDEKYLRALFNAAEEKKENFLRDRLYWLFFSGMSNVAESREVHSLEILRERRGDVPYLNGGLFDMEDSWDERDGIKISNDDFRKILDLFERYNFTVEESTPIDVQVAVDPEMLGKVFEELVTGRHETGSYYTPRSIVSFMCREALKQYLAPAQSGNEAVTRFIDDEDATELQNPEAVLEALKRVRICDPACGSGAYLLGMMHELTRLRAALFKSTKIDDATLYDRKRWIIENNLYGVDNDRFATQIACLRLWLSLAIESDEPHPLPNLDFKIECGDSLTGPAPSEAEKQMSFARTALVNDFRQAKGEYVRENDPEHKRRLRQRIEDLHTEIALALKHKSPRPTEGQIRRKKQEIELLQKNVDSARNDSIKAELEKQIVKYKRTLAEWQKVPTDEDDAFDWAVDFAEVFVPAPREQQWRMDGLHPLLNDFKNQGTLIEQAQENGESGGFDIILANPPYVSALEFARKYSAHARLRLNELYQTARGAYDLYIPFYERGLALLKREGILVFINPNKFLSAKYAVALRQFILSNATFISILDVSGIKIFTTASVYPVVVMLKAATEAVGAVQVRIPKIREMEHFDLEEYNHLNVDYGLLTLLPENIWGFLLSNNISLLCKMVTLGKPLSQCGSVNATSTASEADEYGSKINQTNAKTSVKIINTGTIDRYSSLWGRREMRNAGDSFLRPYLPLSRVSRRRKEIYLSPKIVFAKMARVCEAFLDIRGEFASINTNCFFNPVENLDLRYVAAFCNSKTFMFLYQQFFGALRMSGGYFQFQAPQLRVIPLIEVSPREQKPFIVLVDKILGLKEEDPSTDTSTLEDRIDQLFYKMYNLSSDDVVTIASAYS
jgi:type I restriction-modification system DNA methylase subunit